MNGQTGQKFGLLMLNYEINVWNSPKGTTLTKKERSTINRLINRNNK